MDYLILLTFIFSFLSKQYIEVLKDKINLSNNEYDKNKLTDKINYLNNASTFLITALIVEILIWLIYS